MDLRDTPSADRAPRTTGALAVLGGTLRLPWRRALAAMAPGAGGARGLEGGEVAGGEGRGRRGLADADSFVITASVRGAVSTTAAAAKARYHLVFCSRRTFLAVRLFHAAAPDLLSLCGRTDSIPGRETLQPDDRQRRLPRDAAERAAGARGHRRHLPCAQGTPALTPHTATMSPPHRSSACRRREKPHLPALSPPCAPSHPRTQVTIGTPSVSADIQFKVLLSSTSSLRDAAQQLEAAAGTNKGSIVQARREGPHYASPSLLPAEPLLRCKARALALRETADTLLLAGGVRCRWSPSQELRATGLGVEVVDNPPPAPPPASPPPPAEPQSSDDGELDLSGRSALGVLLSLGLAGLLVRAEEGERSPVSDACLFVLSLLCLHSHLESLGL